MVSRSQVYNRIFKVSNVVTSAGIPKEALAGSNASVYIGSFVKGTVTSRRPNLSSPSYLRSRLRASLDERRPVSRS